MSGGKIVSSVGKCSGQRVMEFGVIRQGTTGTKTVYDTAMTFI